MLAAIKNHMCCATIVPAMALLTATTFCSFCLQEHRPVEQCLLSLLGYATSGGWLTYVLGSVLIPGFHWVLHACPGHAPAVGLARGAALCPGSLVSTMQAAGGSSAQGWCSSAGRRVPPQQASVESWLGAQPCCRSRRWPPTGGVRRSLPITSAAPAAALEQRGRSWALRCCCAPCPASQLRSWCSSAACGAGEPLLRGQLSRCPAPKPLMPQCP